MTKRFWLLPALAILMVAVGGGAAFAVPSLSGPSGIVTVPSALVAPAGQVGAAASWQSMQQALVMYGADNDDFNVWSVQAIAGFVGGAELWATYAAADDVLDTATWGIGGKFQLMRESEGPFTAAFGAGYRASSGDARIAVSPSVFEDIDNDANAWNAYLVASRDFTPTALSGWAGGTRIVGTGGLLWESVDEDFTSTGAEGSSSADGTLLSPFVGVEVMGGMGTTLGLEYRWKDSDVDEKAVFSAVLRQCLKSGLFGEVGTTNANPLGFGLEDQNFFARVGYVFAFGRY